MRAADQGRVRNATAILGSIFHRAVTLATNAEEKPGNPAEPGAGAGLTVDLAIIE